MRFKKFQATQLFTGSQMLDSNKVLITTKDGIIQQIVEREDAGDEVQRLNGILTPGFINCHCHLELSHMKGQIPEKTGLIDFVFKVVTQRHFATEEIWSAIATAEEEMISNGIVAVGDICNNATTLQQKIQHNLTYYNFIEASGWLPLVSNERFERSKKIFDDFSIHLPHNSIVPHAPYSVSEDLWRQISPYFKQKVVTIHNQETTFEDAFFFDGSGDFTRMYQMMKIDNSHFVPGGKTSLQTYFSKLAGAQTVLLVHNTFTTANDIAFANQQAMQNGQQLFWCLCAKANKYIEDRMPPVENLRNQNSNVVVGTDSLASNNSLSILDELKILAKAFPQIPKNELLQWATLNGATALNLQQSLGSFDKGKKPGVLLINENFTTVKRLI